MAANIEERENGRYSFVENGSGGRAWHGIGMVCDVCGKELENFYKIEVV